MKFSFIFLFIVGLHVFATGFAQSRISMNAEGVTIREALKQIEKQTDYRVFDNNTVVASVKEQSRQGITITSEQVIVVVIARILPASMALKMGRNMST